MAVSCSADRQALGKITREGIFLEQLETDPARFMPDVEVQHLAEGDADQVVQIDLTRPMDEIRATLSKYPVKTRVMLTGPMVVARDIAHAKIKERLDAGQGLPQYMKDHCVYYAGPAKTPDGMASGSFGPTTAGRMDSYVDEFQAAGGSFVMLAKGNRSRQVTDACKAHGGFYLGSIGGPAARLAQDCITKVEVLEYAGARHGGGVEDRGAGLPRVHRRRRQGQRLLRPREQALRRWRRHARVAALTDRGRRQYTNAPTTCCSSAAILLSSIAADRLSVAPVAAPRADALTRSIRSVMSWAALLATLALWAI